MIANVTLINNMKINSSHTTLNKLREKNKIFFNNAKFHGDKSYSIDDVNKILTVVTAHGKVRYSFEDSYRLEYIRE